MGPPGTATAPGQNPPATAHPPLVAFWVEASAWPMVPVTFHTPPVELAPPPSRVEEVMAQGPPDWAWQSAEPASVSRIEHVFMMVSGRKW
jgi:hypothetical protein